ncbi:hypothetical protein CAI21_20695 [Alkalilimnicola ehrlichii]|uniref:DUF3592 domain-containing protein n=1 Tax=Alkalilimnicola ehrlichii TaxID=351052 RepID=A0A3E0WIL5_9GAMM|nr:DUF3592 domain-containing protein [Alkalilimnicola ehrlichii]RFA24708.1 hypothetical protein CAI21_20695 [Alkalilimnicola ehrlichii]RFA31806.1 hypothetical protein CAL65_21465 [Alkalilimnicola ehrlichii]
MDKLKHVPKLFLAVGLLMLAGALIMGANSLRLVMTAESAVGTVVELDRRTSQDSDGRTRVSYRPVVRFQGPEGMVTYRSSNGSNPPRYYVGQRVDMLYNPSNPSNARIDGFFDLWAATLFLALMGAVFTGIGGVATRSFGKRAKTIKLLKQSGHRVRAVVNGFDWNTSIRFNGRSPWRITCQWQDPTTQQVHVFYSEDIWQDPQNHIKPGEEIDVLIDPRDPSKLHYVDTHFLPR